MHAPPVQDPNDLFTGNANGSANGYVSGNFDALLLRAGCMAIIRIACIIIVA